MAAGAAQLEVAELVRVKASSESEAERRAVEALERWAYGPGAGWNVVAVTQWHG